MPAWYLGWAALLLQYAEKLNAILCTFKPEEIDLRNYIWQGFAMGHENPIINNTFPD